MKDRLRSSFKGQRLASLLKRDCSAINFSFSRINAQVHQIQEEFKFKADNEKKYSQCEQDLQSEDLKHDEEERRSDTEAAINGPGEGAVWPSLGELLESAQHQHKVLQSGLTSRS